MIDDLPLKDDRQRAERVEDVSTRTERKGMDFEAYYGNNETYITTIDARLAKFVEIARQLRSTRILDVGCGGGTLLNELAKTLPLAELAGTDVYRRVETDWDYRASDVTDRIDFEDERFDTVILGEVIEHVPDPDHLLSECRRVLGRDGVLIISTPNLVSWANRLMVLSGTQPFFTETSSQMNLGRRFPILGQGGKVQGHLKIFTHRSLSEILELNGFSVLEKHGAPFFFPFPFNLIDRFASRFPSIGSDLVFVAQKTNEAVPSAPPAIE